MNTGDKEVNNGVGRIYTIRLALNEAVAGRVQLAVSTAIRGSVLRVLSNPITLTVDGAKEQ